MTRASRLQIITDWNHYTPGKCVWTGFFDNKKYIHIQEYLIYYIYTRISDLIMFFSYGKLRENFHTTKNLFRRLIDSQGQQFLSVYDSLLHKMKEMFFRIKRVEIQCLKLRKSQIQVKNFYSESLAKVVFKISKTFEIISEPPQLG